VTPPRSKACFDDNDIGFSEQAESVKTLQIRIPRYSLFARECLIINIPNNIY
jgi:hypothetical protein